MKNRVFKYLIICLLLLIAIVSVFNLESSNKDYLESIARKTEKIIQHKQKVLQKDLLELEKAILKNSSTLEKYKTYSDFEEDLKNDGFVLIAYQKDSLVFWSDNSFIVPAKRKLEKNLSRVIRCKTGWYYVQKHHVKSFDLYGFLLLQRIYPYQNKFLKNHFPNYLKVPNSIELALDEKKGVEVKNAEGEYLFSLSQKKFHFGTRDGSLKGSFVYASLLLLFLILTGFLIREIKNYKYGILAFIVWGAFLVLVRYLMLNYTLPTPFSDVELFSPILFASSFYYPSLGDFLLNAIFLFVYVFHYCKYHLQLKLEEKITTRWFGYFVIIHSVLFTLLYCRVSNLFISLILDSSINFQAFFFQADSIFVFVGLLIIMLMLFSIGQILYLQSRMAPHFFTWKKYFIFSLVPQIIVLAIVSFYQIPDRYYYFWFFPLGLSIFIGILGYTKDKNKRYSFYILLLLLAAISTANILNAYSEKKERANRKVAAMNLSTEYDPTSENLLQQIQKDIYADPYLKKLCQRPFYNEHRIYTYLQDHFFSGYWDQFHFQFTLCGQSDDLKIEPENQYQNCFRFFHQMIEEAGEMIPNTDFYYLNEFDGMVSYIGVLELVGRNEAIRIYIRLDSKSGTEGFGYPELLLDEKVDLRPSRDDYSYAKYRKGKLISSSGSFNYFMNSKAFGENKEKIYWKNLDNYSHLIYPFDDNCVIVSYPIGNWWKRFILIPYLFVFFYLFGLVFWVILKFPWKFNFRFSFKYRIQYSIIGLLMLFFLLLGGGTIYYTINETKQSNNRALQEKLQLVKREVLLDLEANTAPENLSMRLRELSALIYADIHVYDLSGELISTSREEIFTKKLQARKMNFAAYNQMYFKGRTSFIHKEEIGSMSYLSAYEALVDGNNELIAFVNLPYFLKSQEMEKEMFDLILAGINLHVFMILLAIFISVFISNKITYPLKMIQNRLKATRLGSYGDKIEYAKDDEIGNLVKEYNQMLVELEASAEKLAKSERESAWREMARQIAHEIKNPLTPMKLSIQFLQRRLADKPENWEEHFKRVSKTLIEQINTLSSIATAFSNFAKMPLANNQEQNLIEIIQHVSSLFKNDDLIINLNFNELEHANVWIDKEHFIRVFVNLINNAIQAIPDERDGKVTIQLEERVDNYLVRVIDNGSGIKEEIKEKLFYPNFTTKTSGMGLGLAIVKNIVQNAKGKIWVESELGVGSCFYIQIPKYKEV